MSHTRSLMERIIRELDAIDEIKEGVREIYKEAKDSGHDKTALGQAVREIRNREKNATVEAQERHSLVGLYLADFDSAHAGARAIAQTVPTHEVQ